MTVDLMSGLNVAERENGFTREEGQNPRATRTFVITGTHNCGEAYSALISFLHSNFSKGRGLIATFDIPLSSIRMNKLEFVPAFEAECLFEFPDQEDSKTSSDINAPNYSYPDIENDDYTFTCSGNTSHITHSIGTLAAVPAVGETVRNFDGGIGINDAGTFDGVDVLTPCASFSITVSRGKEFLTSAKRLLFASATGSINSAPFDNYAAGELLFKGISARPSWYTYNDASGNIYKDWYWRITYNFDASPNVVINFGGQTFVKMGWDYLWKVIEKTENETTGQLDVRVTQVNVERVYPAFDFNLFGLSFPAS